MSPTAIVGYLALFVAIGISFLFANLLLGKFLRPKAPNEEKLEIYECGEPTIGSSFVQFDLRFYVVALLFIIFDVEVAFFFPWAVVYGKATHLMDPKVKVVQVDSAGKPALSNSVKNVLGELGVSNPGLPDLAAGADQNAVAVRTAARTLAYASFADILAFFAVLMVGFAYVWRRGDLDWVRAVSRERAMGRDDTEPSEESLAMV